MSSEEGKLARIRGIKALLHDAVQLTVDRVADGHASAARNAVRILDPISPEIAPVVGKLWQLVVSIPLTSVQVVNRLIERTTDTALDVAVIAALGPWIESPAAPVEMRSDISGTGPWLSDATLGALNGAVGDYLYREKNPLDLGFSLRSPSAEPSSRKVAVFVHGLGATEWSWCWDALAYHGDASANFGTLLARDLGFAPLFARYNTGRHIFENGQLLAEALEERFGVDPSPIDELILIGHSMGGLVVRSACHFASEAGHRWVGRLSKVFSLGTPHQGAPLEKLGHLLTMVLETIDHPATQVSAELLRRRSAGIKDLRHGTLVDESWLKGQDAPPKSDETRLLEGVTYYFLAATVTKDRDHPLGQLIGDAMVRVASASGPRTIENAESFRIETECFSGIAHHQLQNHPDVYAWLKRALANPSE